MAASVLFISPARAHHGQEFFLLYDAQVQKPRHGILQGQFSFIDEGTDDSIGLSPSLSLGILPRTAFNLRADFTDEAGDSWAYRSIEPGFQFDLTPPDLKLPIRFGLAVAYQFAGDGSSSSSGHSHSTTDLSGGTVAHVHNDSASQATHSPTNSSAVAGHDHSTHDHGTPPVSQPGVDLGPDALTPEELAAIEAENAANAAAQTPAAVAPSAPGPAKPKPKPKPTAEAHDHASHDPAEESGHSHSGGIHNHDDNLFTARLIFEADVTPDTLVVGNLISVLPEGGSAAWGYAIGVRHRFRPGLAVGVEALGDFDSHGYQEVLGAVFWEPMPHVLLKVGVGSGLTSVSPDATLRAGVLWMF